MILVDKDIKTLLDSNRIIIKSIDPDHPFDPDNQIGPSSIDLRLGTQYRKYKEDVIITDLSSSGETLLFESRPDADLIIQPLEIILATSLEMVLLPSNIAGFLTGRSSIARLGLMVQCCQNLIQPGNQSLVPLQLINITDKPIKIKSHLKICQLILMNTSTESERPYFSIKDAKYKDELMSPTASKIGLETGQDKISDFKDKQVTSSVIEEVKNLRKQIVEHPKNPKAENKKLISILLSGLFIFVGIFAGIIINEIITQGFIKNVWIVVFALTTICITLLILLKLKER